MDKDNLEQLYLHIFLCVVPIGGSSSGRGSGDGPGRDPGFWWSPRLDAVGALPGCARPPAAERPVPVRSLRALSTRTQVDSPLEQFR